MKRLTATVHGHVQGVAFRANTQREASRLNLAGWVENRWDGSVKVVAEGADDVLDRFLRWLHQGPPASRVERVEVNWSDGTGELRGFRIRH
jgi:acylphosphatase